MKKIITVGILCIIGLSSFYAQGSQKSSTNKGLKFKPIIGAFLYDRNQSIREQFRIIKPGLNGGIQLGLALQLSQTKWEFTIRRTIETSLIARSPGITINNWKIETLIGGNRVFHIKGNPRFRYGCDFLIDQTPSIGSQEIRKWGFAPFFSIPFDWLDIEFRAHWIMEPITEIIDLHRYRIFFTYRF